MRKKSDEKVWWRLFQGADVAYAAMLFPCIFYDGPGEGFADDKERLSALKFNLKKFSDKLTPKQRESFNFWIDAIERSIYKMKETKEGVE